MDSAITRLDLPQLPLIASGKVRDVFAIDDSTLLFVATDRISAYDVVLKNVGEDPAILPMRDMERASFACWTHSRSCWSRRFDQSVDSWDHTWKKSSVRGATIHHFANPLGTAKS